MGQTGTFLGRLEKKQIIHRFSELVGDAQKLPGSASSHHEGVDWAWQLFIIIIISQVTHFIRW